MRFEIFGGNTKDGPKKEVINKDKKYEIPSPEVTHAHIYNGQLCFGKVTGIKHPPIVNTFVETKDGSSIKIMTTGRGKFIEIPRALPGSFKVVHISFPDWGNRAGIDGIVPKFHP